MNNDDHIIPASELIINEDGTIFHLHMLPSDLQDNVILVGDPNRVEMISSLLDSVYSRGANREFVWCSGEFRGSKITILSTGIGSDNIDIVLNELDALANVDLATRTVKNSLRKLNIVRLGTCGVVQDSIEAGEILISRYAIGIDSLANFYELDNEKLEPLLSSNFVEHTVWNEKLSYPYGVKSSDMLFDLFKSLGKEGITVTAPGFYAPQGRSLRLKPSIANLVDSFSSFSYNGAKIINLEMEAAPIMALSASLGHNAITLCVGIAQRANQKSSFNYHRPMQQLAEDVLLILSKADN